MTVVTNALNINDDGIQDFNATLGTFDATSLTMKGDLLGYTGTAHQRFPVGMDGYVLKADDTQDVGWRWACPSFEFISSATASSSSTIEFNNFQDADCYNGYKLVWQNVTHTGTTFSFLFRLSTDNGLSWRSSGYQYARESIRDNTGDAVYPYSSSGSYIQINATDGGDTRNLQFSGEAFIFNSSDPSTYLQQGFTFTSSNHTNISGGQSLTSRGWAITDATDPINGFQFYMSSGNITDGNFYLYGMRS